MVALSYPDMDESPAAYGVEDYATLVKMHMRTGKAFSGAGRVCAAC